MGNGGHDTFYAGTGGDTLQGGNNDTFHLVDGGNDVVYGGKGVNVVDFDGAFETSANAHVTITGKHAATIDFTDGQVVKVTGVETLNFHGGGTTNI
jgi:hypothetical protein